MTEQETDSLALEGEPAALVRGFWPTVREIVQLSKPRLSSLVLLTTAGGVVLAPGPSAPVRAVITLVMTMLAVAAANTLNCWLERETDGLMKRTRTRPLPAGRIEPRVALVVGLGLSVLSVTALSTLVNPISGALAALAIVSYVAVYTPMKYRSPHALIVGALPGAIPPLLGWVSVTNRIDLAGWALFAVLFVWQLPHFLAIALYLKEDYRRAGIRVLPLTHGEWATKICLAAYAALLLPVTWQLVRLRVAGPAFGVAAVILGLAFTVWTLSGLRAAAGPRWARGAMLASVGYLTLLFAALALDAH